MLVKQDGWNEVKGFVGGGRSITQLWETGKKWLMGDTEVIVFGRFLLDCVPIKLNKFNGIGERTSVETARGDGRGRDIDGRVERKVEERKKPLHYRDQLLGSVSYGVCCTKCHVALLHWDSVWRERGVINHTERERKLTENQKSADRKKEVESLERKERGAREISKPWGSLLTPPLAALHSLHFCLSCTFKRGAH